MSADLVQKEEFLRQIQAAFIAQPTLSRGQFNQLVLNTNFTVRAPAIFAMGFIRPVAAVNLDQYVLDRRSDTDFGAGFYANFLIQAQSSQLHVLEMVSPLNRRSAQWLGEDWARIPHIHSGLEMAKGNGQVWGSVVNLAGMPKGDVYALYLPVYQTLFEQPNQESLQYNYLGSAVAWLKLSDLLAGTERTAHTAGFALRLIDQGPQQVDPSQSDAVLFSSSKWPQTPVAAEQNDSQLLSVLGRQWRLELTRLTGPLQPSEQRLLLLLALLGCVISGVLAFIFHRYAQHNRQLQQAVKGQEKLQRISFERQSRAILDAVSDPLILRDISGKVIFANTLAEQRFGHNGQSLLGESSLFFDSAVASNLAMPMQITQAHQDRDGVERQYDVMIKPLRNEGLNWVGNVLHARDISVSAAMMDELRYKLARLSELVEVSSDWFWEQDAQARFTYVSGGFFADLDVNPAMFIGKCRWELGAGGLSEAQWAAHRSVLASHQPYRDFEYQAFLNNQVLYFSVSGRPIFDEDGTFAGFRGVGRNVTGMRNAQAALLEERQRALATLESIADGVLT
ncbi:MAG: CHASE domain-containing protein, partial [Deefgea sp.]